MKTDKLTYTFVTLRDNLHRSAMTFLKNDEDAKDAMQDTFFNLWKSGKMDTELEARNKLFTVLRNICIDRLRKPKILGLDNINSEKWLVSPNEYEDIER